MLEDSRNVSSSMDISPSMVSYSSSSFRSEDEDMYRVFADDPGTGGQRPGGRIKSGPPPNRSFALSVADDDTEFNIAEDDDAIYVVGRPGRMDDLYGDGHQDGEGDNNQEDQEEVSSSHRVSRLMKAASVKAPEVSPMDDHYPESHDEYEQDQLEPERWSRSRLSKDDSTIGLTSERDVEVVEMRNKYDDLKGWRATKVTFYKNGDPFYPGFELRFKPGIDMLTMEALYDKVNARLQLPHGVRYIFDLDGFRMQKLTDLKDHGKYVCSSYKRFKTLPYGGIKTKSWHPAGSKLAQENGPNSPNNKPGSKEGRVIRIINKEDTTIQSRVLLNLKTSQPFEDVLEDLGQVLGQQSTWKMTTITGHEVRSFSQLRNEFSDITTFYLSSIKQYFDPHGVKRHNSEPEMRRRRDAARWGTKSKGKPAVLPYPNKPKPVTVLVQGLKRSLYPPTRVPESDPRRPSRQLNLDWVYGYNSGDVQQNLWSLPSGHLLYSVASVAVIYDKKNVQQKHYTEHTEDIKCMAMHPNGKLVASGQGPGVEKYGYIRVWRWSTLETTHVVGLYDSLNTLQCIAFSEKDFGEHLLAVDAGMEHVLTIWQWQDDLATGKIAMQQDLLVGAVFHPLDTNLVITYGKNLLGLWNRRRDGLYEKHDIAAARNGRWVTAVEFLDNGDLIAGDTEGFISIYTVTSDGSYYVRKQFQAHQESVSNLKLLPEGTLLSTGEADRRLVAWDTATGCRKVVEAQLPENAGEIREVCFKHPGQNDGIIYVGTSKNLILEGTLQRRFSVVVFGHSKQLWSLAIHPDEAAFVTAGHDCIVAKWAKRQLQWKLQVQSECISAAYNPLGTAVVVGTVDGHFVVLNEESGDHVTTLRVTKNSAIQSMAYSPDGDQMALGGENGNIYLYHVTFSGFSYTLMGRVNGVAAHPICQMDWSTEGLYLQTVTNDYLLTYWNVKSRSPVKDPSRLRDVQWDTQTGVLNYYVSGIWDNNNYPVESIITTVHKSPLNLLLAVGDSNGYIRLFRYPCTEQKAAFHEEKVYSSGVAAVRFLYDNSALISIGGNEAALMEWSLDIE